jgi:hypothetical protein
MTRGRRSITLSIDTSPIERALAALGDDIKAAIRPAAQAAAEVLYEDVKKNVRAIGRKTGILENSIYQVYSKSLSSKGDFSTYHISWNTKKAKHGWLVENGYLRRYQTYNDANGYFRLQISPGMQGKPIPSRGDSQAYKDSYVRPAMAKYPQAIDAAMKTLTDAYKLRTP